jgi:hypothetical protein
MKHKAPFLIATFVLACTMSARGHVPHIERYDYSWEQPLSLADGTLSVAVYGWLQSRTDVDIIEVTLNEPNSRLFAEMLVPVCPRYTTFQPQFAVLGPPSTLFSTDVSGYPFPVPEGWAALVPDNEPALDQREIEYEPFGGKSYYVGASLDLTVPDAGVYYIVVWNNAGRRGDYVLAIGAKEVFEGPDLVRALVNTQVIRENGELHTPCGPGASR